MPMLIEHIDAIARKKQRGVLYLEFHSPISKNENIEDEQSMFKDESSMLNVAWETFPLRRHIIEWLDAHDITWKSCGHIANTSMMMSYCGQIYIDLPYDTSLPEYQSLEQFLEFPDGKMRFPEVTFCYLSLEMAMVNAAHDEIGFWERWAEGF